MKITTIVREGQDRAAVVLDLTESASVNGGETGQRDSFGPPAGYRRFYVDVTSVLSLFAERREHRLWVEALTTGGKPFITVRKLLSGGNKTLDIIRELLDELENLHAKGDSDFVAPALVQEGQAQLRTPVPDSPLYLVCHNNNPIPWRKQMKGDAVRHISQVPSVRFRTVNSLLGQDETLYLPAGFHLGMGTEFGFVIGAEAKMVKAEDALEYVAGYVCTNDCYSGMFGGLLDYEKTAYALFSNVQTADKCTDGCGPVGPWIATSDDVGKPHDLITRTWQDGVLRDRAHTGSYIRGVEEIIERFSHMMTLPSGTIVSLGAAGWDGFFDEPADRESGRSLLEAEIEKVGVLRTPIRYPEENRKEKSPYFFVGTVDGSSPFERLLADRSVLSGASNSTLPGLPAPSIFWMLIGNQKDSAEYEPENIHSDSCPVPMPLPAGSLAAERPEDGIMRVELPPGKGTITAACQLAVVVGPDAVYQVPAEKAGEFIAGHAVLLSIHDSEPFDQMELSKTIFEHRWGLFLGYPGDGRHVLGPVVPGLIEEISDVLFTVGRSEQTGSPSWYEFGGPDVIAHLSKSVTLLPGDVIGLGPLGKPIELTSEDLNRGAEVSISCKELPTLDVIVARNNAPQE